MRRPTDKKTKRQDRMNQAAIETGYTIPSSPSQGYASGYDKKATGGYQRPQKDERYDSGGSDRKKDDGIPL